MRILFLLPMMVSSFAFAGASAKAPTPPVRLAGPMLEADPVVPAPVVPEVERAPESCGLVTETLWAMYSEGFTKKIRASETYLEDALEKLAAVPKHYRGLIAAGRPDLTWTGLEQINRRTPTGAQFKKDQKGRPRLELRFYDNQTLISIDVPLMADPSEEKGILMSELQKKFGTWKEMFDKNSMGCPFVEASVLASGAAGEAEAAPAAVRTVAAEKSVAPVAEPRAAKKSAAGGAR